MAYTRTKELSKKWQGLGYSVKVKLMLMDWRYEGKKRKNDVQSVA